MSGYSELARLGVRFRPIDQWPGELTRSRRYSPFKAGLSSTTSVLARELHALNAKTTIVQVALTERDLRLDGFPKSGRTAAHPGVIVAFESRHGPLKFAVDTFREWEDNLRAIALGMEALRKVDRYAVTKRGEQYTGWKELTASTDPADTLTADQALEYVARYMEPDVDDLASAIRKALFATHPDHGGNPDEFRIAMRAKELLGV